jgi:hypothetical protein
MIAAVLMLAAPGAAQTSEQWRDLHWRKTACYETECILNPAGTHRFLKPSLGESRFVPVTPQRVVPARPSAPPARSRGLPGLGDAPGIQRGSSPVIPGR